MTHWGIVGGGMLGMTIAARLRQSGHEVTLLERAPEMGGLAATWRLGELVWDKHYHVILKSDQHLLGLLSELGLDAEVRWNETRTGCYADGRLYSVSNTAEFLRFPPLSIFDKVRLAWTILLASRISDWRSLEKTSVENWLTRHSGRHTFEVFWKPLLRSKLGENYKLASASFIWAIIQRLYGARRTGMKRETFGYVTGGYARILDRFSQYLDELGVAIVLGARVESVKSADGGVTVVLEDGDAQFDKVVVTPASPVAASLIQGLGEQEATRMRDVTYQGILCASILTSRPLAGFYVTNITDDWVPFTGVIEMSALVDRETFGGKTLIYLPRYTTSDDEVAGWSDGEVEDRFTQALETMYPGFNRDQIEVFQISRVRYVLPVSTIGYSEHVPPMQTSVPGVYTVNSSQIVNGTLNVNETVQLAEDAVSRLNSAEALRQAHQTWVRT